MNSENLKRSEFDEHIKNGTLRLAFIGMSNCGKSYRSKVLESEENFFWYHVDGEIQKQLGFKEMSEISSWLGYPSSSSYKEHETLYLQAEGMATKVDVLDTGGKNLVFDTTGSVIYLDEGTRAWLKNDCLIVNLDVGEESIQVMLEKFISEPKPVIWNDFFKVTPNEKESDTIARCYPALLKDRLIKYSNFAHITIPAKELFDRSGEETLLIIKARLRD